MKNENSKGYQENVDVLITHGEEALTFRKDDPTTQEYLNKKAQENLDAMKKYGKDNLWYGISISNARQKGESYENYRERLGTVKNLEKIYKKLGREECKRQFPNGFAYAIYNQIREEKIKKEDIKSKMTATITNEDETTQNIPVEINNDKK